VADRSARALKKRIRYPRSHWRIRAAWRRTTDAGLEPCRRCGKRIRPGEAWHLDHRDDGLGYLGPSHAFCNESAGGRKGNAKGPGPSRDWVPW
jgi:hypothetical protein